MSQSKFVIMKHNADKAGLHYDLRFKMPKSNDWASYAVPKGVPTSPGKKVLAIKTTVHSEKEALLTGHITDGYGAGKLSKWDGGSCDIIKYDDSHVTIEFKGSKIKGIYHLISTGVMDKDFKKPTYLLFKGKAINERSGMASRVPSGGLKVDTEEGQSEETGTPLKWSISEGVKIMKEYIMVCQFTAMKGFFKKKPAGDYLIIAIKQSDGFFILQFHQNMKDNMYLVSVVDGAESPDDEFIENSFDQLRYNTQVKILEDKVPYKFKTKPNMKLQFAKPSKYLGKSLELFNDSRLPNGYYIAKCNVKKGFEPAISYKISANMGDLDQAKKMRAFTTSRLKSITAKK